MNRLFFSYVQVFLPSIEKDVANELNVLQASIINILTIMTSVTLVPTTIFLPHDY